MKIHLHIESDLQQIEVHIHAPEYNETVEQLMKKLKQQSASDHIAGYKDSNIHLLQVQEVFSIYSDNGKVYIQTDDDEFEAKNKLYELEQRFEHQFIILPLENTHFKEFAGESPNEEVGDEWRLAVAKTLALKRTYVL